MKIRAVLFDLDGTLLDTLDDLADSMNSVLDGFGFPTHHREAYKVFVGDGMQSLVLRAIPQAHRGDDALAAHCLASMREEYGKHWNVKTRPYEGIPELLEALTHQGIKMAVLSNKPDDFTKEMTAELLAGYPFSAVLGERPGVPRKPDPTAAMEIADQLEVQTGEFLYLGDTATDMKTAVSAGMLPVGALWGFRSAEELQANGAKHLIKGPHELLKLL